MAFPLSSSIEMVKLIFKKFHFIITHDVTFMIGSKPRAVSNWWGEDVRSILNSTSISMSNEYKSK